MSFIDRLARIAPAGKQVIGAFGENILKPTVGKAGAVLGTVASSLLGLSLNVADGISKTDWIKIGQEASKKAKLAAGVGLAGLWEEANLIGGAASLFKSQLLGDAPISTSLLGPDHIVTKALRHTGLFRRDDSSLITGIKANKKGVAVLMAGSLVANVPKATREFVDMYKGDNDGRLYTNAPINTYAQQMSSTPVGSSYANNAGATGDLVFALHNQRHDGIM